MLRRSLLLLLAVLFATTPSFAQTEEFRAFIDLDNNLTTGCTVTTVDGLFDGVEEILATTVEMDQVTAVTRSTCDQGNGTFGAPSAVVDFPTPWAVGSGLGTGGTDVIETYFPLHTVPAPQAIRLGFDSSDGFGDQDAILTEDGEMTGPDVVIVLAAILEIPTLSTLALALLSLLIAAAAWRTLRRRPSNATWMVLIVASSLVAVSVLAVGVIMLDGDPADWTGAEDASADDALGDTTATVDLRAAFAALDPANTYLYFRFDAARGTPPTAVDDAATIPEDAPATPIDVLANETNPSGFPLTVTAITTQATNGTVVITNAGADLTYEPNPDFCNDGAPTDDFVYELNNDTTATVAVTVTCVDDAPTITAIADQTIAEDTSTAALAFTVADIDTMIGSLTVTATSSNQVLIPDANLTLGGAGANRTITVTPAADENGGPAIITVTVDDGTTAVPTTFNVTVTPGDDPPTITAIADQTINEDGTTGALAFTIADPDTAIGSLIVTASSDDQTLIPDANLTLGGAGANRTITAVPAANENGGPATITITVDDGTTAVPTTFDVTVTPVDNPPTISAIADQTIAEDGTTGALAFTLADIDTAVGSLTLAGTSNNQALIPDANLTFGGAGANRTLTAVPAADANGGPAIITVTVSDATTGVPETFNVTVTAVNDEPSFTAGANENVSEDAGPQTIMNWATGIDDGDPEVAQVLTFTATNTDNALFSAQPAISPTGTLTYTSAANASGSAMVSVTLMDDGGTANPGDDDTSPTQMFTITVSGTNDPPTHTPGGGTAAFVEGAGAVVIDNGITLADPDNTNLASATLNLGILDAGLETLAANTGGTSITAMYTAATGILSLTGADTLVNYQAVLRTVTYNNTSVAPNESNRTITCVVNDGAADSMTANLTVSVTGVDSPPMVTSSTITYNAIGNTLLRVDSADADNHDTALPGRVASSIDLMDAIMKSGASDPDSPGFGFTPKNGETTNQGGTITLDDDGDFFYTPPIGFNGMDSEALNLTDGTSNVAVTLNIMVTSMVWYVEDTVHPKNPAGDTDGRSTDAFETLAAASAASGAGHTILVFETDAPLDEGLVLQDGQKLYGQRVEEEAVSLLPTGLLLEEVADTNARPQIHRTNGAAVTVDASAVNLTGVEIRHLDLRSGDNDAIAVTTGGTSFVDTLLIDENIIGGAGMHGIDLDSAHTAGQGTVEIRDNQITSTINAIDVTHSGSGQLELAINRNTNLTAGARAIRVVETAGTVTVTSLDGNSVHGDTVSDGMFFNAVSFDGDASTAAFEQVDANNSAIGSGGNAIGGSGLVIMAGHGDLLFDDLDIEAGGGGIIATGTGEVNTGAGTGFRLSTGAGSSVNATGGPALSLDPMTASATFASLSSSGSAGNGILLRDVAGTVNAQAGMIIGATSEAILVDQDTVTNALNFTYSGTVTNTANRLIHVDGYPAGTLTFNGTSLSDSGAGGNTGTGILLNNVDGTVNISAASTTLTQSDGTGIAITGDSDGNINVDNTTITNPAGTAIRIVDGADQFGGTFDFDNVDVSHATNNQRLMDVQGLNAGGSVNFDAASALSATDGTGINIASNAGNASVTLNGPVDLGTGASRLSDGQAFTMGTNSAGTTVAIPDLDVFTNGQTAVGASGMGTLDINALSVNTASNGRGLDLTGIISAVDVDSMTCSHSSACVNLATLAATSSTTFTGLALTCSGGTCFNASAARTVEATGTTSDIDATNAVGINLTNTTIGANHFALRSVDASGAANGIVLNSTGTTGGFRVLGDGTDTLGGNDSGGLISGTSADSVLINTSMDVQIANLRVATPGGDGFDIDQLRGTNNAFNNVTVRDADTANTSAVRLNNNAQSFQALFDRSVFDDCDTGQVVFLVELAGAYTSQLDIEDSEFTGHDADALSVVGSLAGNPADTGTIVHNFRRNVVRDSDTDGVSVVNASCGGAANCTYNFIDNQIRNLAKLGNFNGGLLNLGYTAIPVSGGSLTANISGNRIEGTDAASRDHRRGINLIVEQTSGTVPNIDVTINNNDINDLGNREALYMSVRQPGTANIKVTNNRFGTGAFGTTPREVGGTRDCMFAETRGVATARMNLLLDNNTIECDATGSDSMIDVDVRDGSRIDLTMRANTLSTTGTSEMDIDAGPFSTSGTICLDMNSGNVGANANSAAPAFRLEQTAGTFHIEGMGAGPNNAAVVEAFLDPRNNNDVVAVGGGFTNNGGAACMEPPP